MFGLFRKTRKAHRGDDHVWASQSARRAGLIRKAERLAEDGASVLVVSLSAAGLAELAEGLERHAPLACRDIFGQAALRQRLGQPRTISLALAAALPTPAPGAATADAAASSSTTPVEVLVCGRHDRREADDAVVAFADGLGPRATVTFHLSFDDPLLQDLTDPVKDLMQKLGMTDDEPIVHALVTRSIERAQRKA